MFQNPLVHLFENTCQYHHGVIKMQSQSGQCICLFTLFGVNSETHVFFGPNFETDPSGYLSDAHVMTGLSDRNNWLDSDVPKRYLPLGGIWSFAGSTGHPPESVRDSKSVLASMLNMGSNLGPTGTHPGTRGLFFSGAEGVPLWSVFVYTGWPLFCGGPLS